MRNSILSLILILGAVTCYGQKYDFVLQLSPHYGNYSNSELYGKSSINLVDTTWWTDFSGFSVSEKEVVFGVYSEMNYQPIASLSLSMKSKTKLFYQLAAGIQFVKTSYENLVGWYDDKGKFDDFENYLNYTYFNDYEPFSGNSPDSTVIGPRQGLIVQPIFGLGLGCKITDHDLLIAEFGTSSYSVAYQHEWKKLSLGVSAGKVHSIVANTLKVGPWMKKGTNDFDWLDSKSSLLLSAQVNLKLNELFAGGAVSSNDTPKEF
jgi:hypothetical protein